MLFSVLLLFKFVFAIITVICTVIFNVMLQS